MSIDFIGTGSAFNTKLGCNAAYYKRHDSLLLIDCGSDVFSKLKNEGILEDVKNVYVLITHLHGDHVGSLSTLIEYFFWKHGIKVNLYAPYKMPIQDLLPLMGVTDNMYERYGKDQDFILDRNFPGGIFLQAVDTKHISSMKSFGYLLSIGKRVIYYSGDAAEVNTKILGLFNQNKIDIWYQDVAFKDNGVHMFYDRLLDLIPDERRSDFVLMHLEEDHETHKDRMNRDGFIPANILV